MALVDELFTQKDYQAMKDMEDHREIETYRGTVVNDLVIEVTHRVHRMDPERMIYVFSLNHDSVENLFNDDLYWRAEPAKFCHGLPPFDEVKAEVQRMLDYRFDVNEFTPRVLNIEWDPKQPDFDS